MRVPDIYRSCPQLQTRGRKSILDVCLLDESDGARAGLEPGNATDLELG